MNEQFRFSGRIHARCQPEDGGDKSGTVEALGNVNAGAEGERRYREQLFPPGTRLLGSTLQSYAAFKEQNMNSVAQ